MSQTSGSDCTKHTIEWSLEDIMRDEKRGEEWGDEYRIHGPESAFVCRVVPSHFGNNGKSYTASLSHVSALIGKCCIPSLHPNSAQCILPDNNLEPGSEQNLHYAQWDTIISAVDIVCGRCLHCVLLPNLSYRRHFLGRELLRSSSCCECSLSARYLPTPLLLTPLFRCAASSS